MNRKMLPVVMACLVLFVACKADENEDFDAGTATAATAPVRTDTPVSPAISPLPRVSASLPVLPGTAGAAQRLNPPHGQPGHVCGVDVGAPLPAAQAAPAPVTTTVVQPVTTTAVPVPTPQVNVTPPAAKGAKLNPPHGQPGHRCDIAVGAPLNSKPQAKATTTATQAIVAPATKTAPGMNPPHGEPGHVCGIAVGAPLPKTENGKKDSASGQ